MDYIETIKILSPFIYPHEEIALLKWRNKVEQESDRKLAKVYSDACDVLFETIKIRVIENRLVNDNGVNYLNYLTGIEEYKNRNN